MTDMEKNHHLAWSGRRVLVSGVSGFLGSWVTKKLIEQGAHVFGILRSENHQSVINRDGSRKKIHVEYGNLADYISNYYRWLINYNANLLFIRQEKESTTNSRMKGPCLAEGDNYKLSRVLDFKVIYLN